MMPTVTISSLRARIRRDIRPEGIHGGASSPSACPYGTTVPILRSSIAAQWPRVFALAGCRVLLPSQAGASSRQYLHSLLLCVHTYAAWPDENTLVTLWSAPWGSHPSQHPEKPASRRMMSLPKGFVHPRSTMVRVRFATLRPMGYPLPAQVQSIRHRENHHAAAHRRQRDLARTPGGQG